MKVCITGGGTGGHLYTGIALAQSWTPSGVSVVFAGGTYGLEKDILPRYAFPYVLFDVAPFKGRRFGERVKALWKLGLSVTRAVRFLRRERPSLVVGIGGYVSVPVIVASFLLRIPRVIVDQNAVPGMANRLLGKIALRVFVHFKEAIHYFPQGKAIQSGNPIRPSLRMSLAESADIPEISLWKRAGDGARYVLLVLGGSQGARAVNRLIVDWMASLSPQSPYWDRLAIIHQTGKTEYVAISEKYRSLAWRAPVIVAPFFEPIAPYYQAANFVIARSGAGTICELAACGKPAILIPFPYAADNHQEMNARALEAVGGARVLLEREATPAALNALIEALTADASILPRMGQAAKQLDFPDAAETIWRECQALLK